MEEGEDGDAGQAADPLAGNDPEAIRGRAARDVGPEFVKEVSLPLIRRSPPALTLFYFQGSGKV